MSETTTPEPEQQPADVVVNADEADVTVDETASATSDETEPIHDDEDVDDDSESDDDVDE